MRSKEDAHDYRYFPDPDLLPLVLDEDVGRRAEVAAAGAAGRQESDASCAIIGLPAYDAGVLVAEQATADFYETVAQGRDAKIAANWVMGDLFAALNRTGRTIADSPGVRGIARRAARPDGRRHDQRPHRQGGVRGDGRDRRRPRLRSSRRRACARSPTPARSMRRWTQVLAANADKVAEYKAGQRQAVRLLRGPGDEGDGRQRQPGAGERYAEARAD